ncbi:hypothetical protein JHK82_012530 [Glycine max]|uniref:Uncharacterized protein n=2 Tax=Glycine subgen. Soja TaxID=1462606 RepID=A0A0R0K055_SOYBN|nr:hypothetical protein JHK85_012884 [Glycine max]RZC11855.1 hypothetical protein D0Y65_011886 [Glycine soja]KAG5057551.1 hypothetical protein JHK86_012547 [Glycine max]KAG5154561.1 hypothetical protein JHK82_012530 [Glycine max]KAH1133724.1 hypothetical protein GYH30_012229 [Glycine max]
MGCKKETKNTIVFIEYTRNHVYVTFCFTPPLLQNWMHDSVCVYSINGIVFPLKPLSPSIPFHSFFFLP